MVIVSFLLVVFLLHKSSLLLAEGISTYLILIFLGIVSLTIPTGYILSAFDLIGQPYAWALALIAWSGILYLILYRTRKEATHGVKELISNAKKSFKALWNSSSTVERALFSVLGIGLIICSLINLIVLFYTYPNEWDSMTGHLVKCAYYIQNGNMDRLQGTTWSIDFYPNSLPTLQILGFHLFGEKGFKAIHYLSYWIFVLTTYSITREAFANQKGAIFAGFMAALLPSALIQAVTTETDIVQSAYLGIVVLLLIKVYKKASWQNILLFAISTSIWVSHKVTFLLIGPAMAVLAIYVFKEKNEVRKRTLPTLLLMLIGFSIYVLPNGYLDNVKEVGKFSLGALSAPEEVMKWHGIENYSQQDKIKNFEFNILRYSSDFLQLDGLRNTSWGSKINDRFRKLPNKFFSKFALERKMYWVVYPFQMMGNDQMHFYKERPFWGIISFMIVLPIILLLVIRGKIRNNSEEFKLAMVFVLAGTAHFLSLCFSAPYDPIKGRYFMNLAVWLLPLLAWFFVIKKGRIYLLFCSFIIVVSGVFTLSHRGLYPLIGESSIFKLDRIAQLNITRPEGTEAYIKFEQLVPENAVVALGTQQEHEDYVYPLWGKNFKRKLIPIHPFRSKVKPIPKEAQYLFYSEGVIPVMDGDIQLGDGDKTADTPVPESKFYLRKL